MIAVAADNVNCSLEPKPGESFEVKVESDVHA
jgi:hypothetical protein